MDTIVSLTVFRQTIDSAALSEPRSAFACQPS